LNDPLNNLGKKRFADMAANWIREGQTFRCTQKTQGYGQTDPWTSQVRERHPMEDVGTAVEYARLVVQHALGNDPNRPVYLFNLAMRLFQSYFSDTSDLAVRNEAILNIRGAVGLRRNNNPVQAGNFDRDIQLYEQTGAANAFNSAIGAAQLVF
jgi:hypothetical protein